ncbi:hypothetical protein D915_009625 [Fasciola hepatica]|uniref:Uncharacterized protein n=1 Tax=Fasciola hepatica TaxID=6192 RepID=A0A4E0QYH3_FASHE|nr:hypothetical protein D915_009625 [Fasciola hepatica]
MQPTAMKTLRSRQRFPDDPEALVTLTQQQMVLYQSIQESTKHFMNQFFLVTNSYHQLMDDLLQCLDLSWDSTSNLDTNITEIISSMKNCQEFFKEKLAVPVNEQVEKQRMLQAELDEWNRESEKLNQELKLLDKAHTKWKLESKLEKAKYRAEDAASTCCEIAASLRPALVQINADGVQACCRTWIIMSQGFSEMKESLSDLFNELSVNSKDLERQVTTGSLPAWTESSNRIFRSRVSTVNSLGNNVDLVQNNYSIPRIMNSSTRKPIHGYPTFTEYPSSDYLAQKRFVSRSRSLIYPDQKSSQPSNRLSRSSSTTFSRSNSVPENASLYGSEVDLQRNNARTSRILYRSQSSDDPYRLGTIHESGARDSMWIESVQPSTPVLRKHIVDRNATTSGVPMIRKSLITNQSARSTLTEFQPDSPTPRPITITYNSQEQGMQTEQSKTKRKATI